MIRRAWRALYRRLVADRVSGEARIIQFLRSAGIGPGSRVLEVGCGDGVVLARIRDELSVTPVGVEVNPMTIERVRASGFDCYAPDDSELEHASWNALVMSHLIEHFDYDGLVRLLERNLSHLELGGALVIATPLMHPQFYDDCDHVRPYPPEALDQLFGAPGQQVQRQLDVQLELVELWFRRSALALRPSVSSLLGRKTRRAWWHRVATLALLGAFYISVGAIGRRTGWVGMYRRIA